MQKRVALLGGLIALFPTSLLCPVATAEGATFRATADRREAERAGPSAIPQLDDPLIKSVAPRQAQQGQQVLIKGVNFGNVPEARFNGLLASVAGYRPDLGGLVVTVPPGATPGPLVVTNTDTNDASNVADFVVLDGSYAPVCTIDGNITDVSVSPIADVLVVTFNVESERFSGSGVTDLAGNYSVSIDTAGDYYVGFLPPSGSAFYDAWYEVSCDGLQNHEFTPGIELTGRVLSGAASPISNAAVYVRGSGEFDSDALTDGGGDFRVSVPVDDYTVEIEGPVGGRFVGERIGPFAVSSATDLGDIYLDSGAIVSGLVVVQDGQVSGPMDGARITERDFSTGEWASRTTSIADGSFYLASPIGASYFLHVGGGDVVVDSLVSYVTVTGDLELDFPVTTYTHAPQLPTEPTITDPDYLVIQEGQPVPFEVAGARGLTAVVRFSDGGGGWVDGRDTLFDEERGVVVTTVPPLAASGEVSLRVDGVDGPGFPLVVVPGVFDPGPFTTSGVIRDGMTPVENVLVAMLVVPNCGEDDLVDYDLTGPGGEFNVRHGAGDYILFVMPPVDSGFVASWLELSGVVGSRTENVSLATGNVVTARFVDSGIGPVGTNEPIPGFYADAEGSDIDGEDSSVSDAGGGWRVNLPSGEYRFMLRGPFQSRFQQEESDEEEVEPIYDDIDFGDVPIASGYFIEGRVVNPAGDGVAGVEVSAVDWFAGGVGSDTVTADSDGRFRLAAPPGSYDLYFSVPSVYDFFVPNIYGVGLYAEQDVLIYPAIRGVSTGHVQGTVLDAAMDPVKAVTVFADHDMYGWVEFTETCADGSYDLRCPTGNVTVHARPSWSDLCLADEVYDDHYFNGCGADPLSVTDSTVVTDIDFVLDPAGSISGVVVDDLDIGQAYVSVELSAQPAPPACYQAYTETDADGYYEFDGVPEEADYKIRIWNGGFPEECWNDHVGCHDYDPVSVAECAPTDASFHLSGVPGEVADGGFNVSGSPMRVIRNPGTGVDLVIWQPACSAENHVAYFGSIGDYGTYTGCDDSDKTSGNWLLDAPDNSFWVMVGVNGNKEGSYGVDGQYVERPAAGVLGDCSYIQDLGATCAPVSDVPGPVPNGSHVPGTQMTALHDPLTGQISIEWQPTCDVDNHVIYFGPIGGFGTYIDCDATGGLSGSHDINPPAGDVFWVVVGTNGVNEGSYGVDSNLVERPEAGTVGSCPYLQLLTPTCVP